ncbi:MurR/RpiR family transcriptional regulator [Pararoseomonas indoligenes]|uniref:MurR/RpiR family transcriptional regulator n=1 Tax=Roseomonas indoligenes TaxID=2820811 RepID=A0A940MYY5_9PROT|nr:MurR/RpiR family transcriptional regulator [Pararoseomonas indoligenes]MBP0495934.1 MurR/RpiR family transcriptional regulator [Pararoseomonas indoligenes]
MSVPTTRVHALLHVPPVPFTPAEMRVAQVLLEEYPIAGLGTVASLAKRAGVSDPTVVRLIVKLGYEGFPAFQRALLGEVEDRLRSPLMMMEARDEAQNAPGGYLASVEAALAETRRRDLAENHARAATMILDRKARVALHGGRFSRHLAGILHTHLVQFRPGVRHLNGTHAEMVDALVDLAVPDVLIVFDYRRYQADVVDFAEQAAGRGVRIILFTDTWRSPVARHAEVVFTAPVEAASPYDTMVPALAQVETLLACLVEQRDEGVRRRVREIEAVRARNRVTNSGGEEKREG